MNNTCSGKNIGFSWGNHSNPPDLTTNRGWGVIAGSLATDGQTLSDFALESGFATYIGSDSSAQTYSKWAIAGLPLQSNSVIDPSNPKLVYSAVGLIAAPDLTSLTYQSGSGAVDQWGVTSVEEWYKSVDWGFTPSPTLSVTFWKE